LRECKGILLLMDSPSAEATQVADELGAAVYRLTHPRIAGQESVKEFYEPIRKGHWSATQVDDAPDPTQKNFPLWSGGGVMTFGTHCLQLPQTSRDVYDWQAILGHRSIDVTLTFTGSCKPWMS